MPTSEPSDEWSPAFRRAYWVVVGIGVFTVLACGVRAVLTGWVPVGDNAFLALRAHDVFSHHPPLLSTASSGGATSGVPYNHPGAAALWLIAPFVAVAGSAGAALGAAVVNAACLAGVGWLAARASRPVFAAGVMASMLGVCSAMGVQALADPWNPNQATLVFALLLVAACATWCEVPAAVPVGAGAAVVVA
ncbi:MAG: hypothetical protein ACKOYM_02135, partial [Actinomycetes bacterium]